MTYSWKDKIPIKVICNSDDPGNNEDIVCYIFVDLVFLQSCYEQGFYMHTIQV